MPFAMENPAALLLLLALPAIYFVGRGRLSLMAPWRGRTILAVRLASMAAIILALSGLSTPLSDGSMSVAFLVDRSASISPATSATATEWVRQAMGQMKSSDRAAVIDFAGDARVAKPLDASREYRPSSSPGVGGETNLPSALKLASGLLPGSGLRKVVVLSDGWDTAGKVGETVRSLPEGVRVDVVPLAAMEGQPEVLVESMDMPSYIREGDGFDVTAVVGTNHAGPAQLAVLVDGKQTGNWNVQLGAGANLVTMSQKALPLGFHAVDVHLSAEGDTVSGNNSASAFVMVKEKGHVLLVDGNPGSGGFLRNELENSGLRVDRILVSELPAQLPQLDRFDAVVLEDVPGPSLSLDQMKALQSYTRDQGRGLLVVGGKNSYGLGDYASGLMEDILPVSSNVPPTLQRGDLALILVMDRSGSMDESYDNASKIAMAREAAMQAVESLKPDDQIGIIGFDTDPQWIVPVQKVGTDLPSIRSRISRVQASGGTDIFTALKTAYMAMSGVKATTRHITLLTDGQSWKGQYRQLIQQMKNDKITLSTVGIGNDADSQWLSEMAQLGDGRFYFTQRFTDIPKIVYREVTAATKIARVDGNVNPVFVAPSPILRGMNRDGLPPLSGYVATKPKDAATIVLRSSRGDPLLAQWQHGLGRVVSWTADAEGMWSSSWMAQPDYARVWDQSVRWAMAPPIDRGLQVRTQVDGPSVTVTVDSVDRNGQFIDLADTRAQISHPDGTREGIVLQQVAPGRYRAALSETKPGLYRVDVSQARTGQAPATESAGFAVPAAPEVPHLGSNDALLKQLAAGTGGRAIHDPADAFSRQAMPSSPGWEPVWPYLLAGAMMLLVVEVALRRIRALPFVRQSEDDGEAPSEESPQAGEVTEFPSTAEAEEPPEERRLAA